MPKTTTTITLDYEVKEKCKNILDSKGESLSGVINDFLKTIIEKEEIKNGNI